MDLSTPETPESLDALDQLIGEYLIRIDREGMSQRSGIRAAFLSKHPAHQSQLARYFSEEDRVAGTVGQLLVSDSVEFRARVLRYIGEYELLELLELLGRGGMGDVYRARQSKTGRIVAVKVMRLSAPHERFRREIEIAARLRHPNIVTLFEADEDHADQFYSMEYVSGGTGGLSSTGHGEDAQVARGQPVSSQSP